MFWPQPSGPTLGLGLREGPWAEPQHLPDLPLAGGPGLTTVASTSLRAQERPRGEDAQSQWSVYPTAPQHTLLSYRTFVYSTVLQRTPLYTASQHTPLHPRTPQYTPLYPSNPLYTAPQHTPLYTAPQHSPLHWSPKLCRCHLEWGRGAPKGPFSLEEGLRQARLGWGRIRGQMPLSSTHMS